jgi:signal transduction histidine kinase/ActR/RegA family two-component response regulator
LQQSPTMFQTKIKLFIVVFLVLFLLTGLGYGLTRVISSRVTTLLEKRVEQSKQELEKLIDLANANDKNYVTENSYWDEMYFATLNSDTAWITENSYEPLKGDTSKYFVDFLKIVRTDGTDLYSRSFNLHASLDFSFKDYPELFEKVKSNKIAIKFINIKGQTLKLNIASITRSTDFEHKLPPKFYLITGCVINEHYIKLISNLNTNNQIEFGKVADTTLQIDLENSKVVFSNIRSTLNGNDLNLRVTNTFPEINLYNGYIKRALTIAFILVSLLISFLLHHYYRNYYLPLKKMTDALHQKTAQPLNNVKSDAKEILEVASLMKDYFSQTEQLKAEVTQRKISEKELKLALNNIEKTTIEKLQAEQSLAVKAEFLSTMSHEIRTPINGVIGITNLLKDEKLTEQQNEYINALQYSANHLMALVTDILDFSKIESGKVEFNATDFSLYEVCQAIFNLQKPNAVEKNLQFFFEADKQDKQHLLVGDTVRLTQIITNMLGNAIKFTEKGTVIFGYKVDTIDKANCSVTFNVTDTGIGIKDAEKSKLFEGFSQANKEISTVFGGTGLGLAISKKLVELQGGKINFASTYGKGSTFTFTLPFAVSKNVVSNTKTADNLLQNNLKGLNLLVVEDNKVNILVMEKFLQKWQANMVVATNGLEAIEMLKKGNFDVVLMDIHMPIMNGEEATKIIRDSVNSEFCTIPIIAFTANATNVTQQKLLESGFNNYISKPFNPDALYAILQQYHIPNTNA